MTLDEARAELEAWGATCAEIGNYSQAATGEEYVVIVSGGMKDEGERCPCFCRSEADAVRLWRDAINAYANGKSGTLYWRAAPEMHSTVMRVDNYDELSPDIQQWFGKETFWVVYSRLLISDKPQIQPQALPLQPASPAKSK
jgi:hypothetical protein